MVFAAYNLEDMAMIELTYPQVLWFFLLIPLMIFLRFMNNSRWKKTRPRFFHNKTYFRIVSKNSPGRKLSFILEYIAIGLMIIALSGPGVGTEIREVKREGVDIIVTMDLSLSMCAADISPSRLQRTKLEVIKLISNVKGDRIGLVGFAGVAHLQCPLTLDHRAARLLLDVMDETLLPVQGSALGDAIRVAVDAFPEKQDKHKVIILISDGEDHEKHVEDAAKYAAENNVVIYSVGAGTISGAPVPLFKNGEIVDYKRDDSGKVIMTYLNEDAFWNITDITGGDYIRLTDVQNPLLQIYSDILSLDKKEFQTHEFGHIIQLYQGFLFAGLLLYILSVIIPERRKNDNER
jgi:Ca-activated chloride channel homolog